LKPRVSISEHKFCSHFCRSRDVKRDGVGGVSLSDLGRRYLADNCWSCQMASPVGSASTPQRDLRRARHLHGDPVADTGAGQPDGILEVSPIKRVHPGARQGVAPGNRSDPRRWSVRSRRPLVERPGRYAGCVPRPRRDLTTTEKRHLHSLEGRISRLEAELQATRREWAELVEEAGQAAVARELGVSRQAVADRLRRIRANREGRNGRR